MRRFRLSLVIGGSVALVSALCWVAMAAEPPEVVTIADCQNKQAAVEFPHKAHWALAECVDCHHTQEGLTEETAASTAVEKCGACHNEPEKAETPKCSEMSPTKNHFHITCMGCHKDAVKKDAEAKAPTKCQECHPKA